MAYPITLGQSTWYLGTPLKDINNMHTFLKLFPRKIKGKKTASQRSRSNRRKK